MEKKTLVNYCCKAIREFHQELAIADGPHYQYDPGDPRAMDMLLTFIGEFLVPEEPQPPQEQINLIAAWRQRDTIRKSLVDKAFIGNGESPNREEAGTPGIEPGTFA